MLRLRPSRYNFWSTTRSGAHLLFNGLTGALVELDDAEAASARTLLEHPRTAEDELSVTLASLGFLVDDDAVEVAELQSRADATRGARSGCLEFVISPTYACNFRCTYCYVEPRPGVMSRETENAIVLHAADVLDGYSQFEISWFGGEPLLCLDTVDRVTRQLRALATVRRIGFRAYVTTNGYLLDTAVVRRLEAAGVEYLHVTIDGSRETHDRLRVKASGEPTYDVILANMLGALETSSKLKFTLRANVDEHNVAAVYRLLDEIPKRHRGRIQLNVTPIRENDVQPTEALYVEIDRVLSRALELGFVYYPVSIPVGKGGFCFAEKEGNLHIGPDASLYCCSPADFKPDTFIGDLHPNGRVEFIHEYGSRFRNRSFSEQCSRCLYLCFCMGGCPLDRSAAEDGSCMTRFSDIDALIRNRAASEA